VTLAVPESRRLPESTEAALYLCGRILVDAVDARSGPVALTLAMSAEDVELTATAPPADLREDAMRLLRDRVAVLEGQVTTTSYERVTEIRCHVPLGTEAMSSGTSAAATSNTGPRR